MRKPIAVLIAAGALATPAAAGATEPSTVTYDATTSTTTFRSGAAPADVVIDEQGTPEPFQWQVSDAGNPLVARGGCQAGTPVLCPFSVLSIRLGANGDRLSVWTANTPATINTGGGDDVVSNGARRGTLRAGLGDDTVRANGRELAIYGDGGDDTLYGTEDFVALYGGDGNDLVVSDLRLDLGGLIEGGDGYDALFMTDGQFDGGGRILGGGDPDIIGFLPGAEGRTTVTGGGGGDTIHGSEGTDDVSGGAGNELIDVYGGGADTVDCGANWDEVYVDSSDTVAGNCERVTLAASPADERFDAAYARALALLP
jgi:Ca2+-binding RTX toxin-like protein